MSLADKHLHLVSLPSPSAEAVNLRKVEGGIAAVTKFSGKPSEEIVLNKERELRSAILKDGLRPQQGCLLGRYNDPGSTNSFIMVCCLLLCSMYTLQRKYQKALRTD